MSELTQLFEFLSSPHPSARHLALQNLIGHTARSSPNRHIFIPSAAGGGLAPSANASGDNDAKIKALKDLCMLCRDQAHIAHDALSALVNLADTLAVARHLVDEDYLVFLVSYTANPSSPLSPLSAMLLSNLSSHPTLTAIFANLRIPLTPLPDSTPNYYLPASRAGSSTVHADYREPEMRDKIHIPGKRQLDDRDVDAIRALVQAFEDGATEGVESTDADQAKLAKRKGGVHFLASVFANISMLPATRPLLLHPYPTFPEITEPEPTDEPLLTKIVPYTEHADTIRRGGALGCIKNCAMDRASHAFLLATEDDRVTLPSDTTRKVKGVDVLPWVLSPLMGPEEIDMEDMDLLPASLQLLGPDKVRERDHVLRLMCIEILLLLSSTYTGRVALRKRGAYIVVREAHKVETDDKISEAIERLVNLLQGEEGRDTKREALEGLVPADGDEMDVMEV